MAKPEVKLDSGLMFKNSLFQILVVGLFEKEPCLETRTESDQGGRKSSGSASASSTDSRKNLSNGRKYS